MDRKISALLKFFLLVQILSSTTSVDFDCNPKQRCLQGYDGEKVPDPEDCFSYYRCIIDNQGNPIPSDAPIRCPIGEYFSDYYGCAAGVTCENQCVTVCKAICTIYNYERVANLDDCSSYYECAPGGEKVLYSCPSTSPYFDGTECTKEKFGCCNCCDECTPYCDNPKKEVADPYDCKSYYLCLVQGFLTDDDKYQCGTSEYFNPSLGRCDADNSTNPCTPLCNDN